MILAGIRAAHPARATRFPMRESRYLLRRGSTAPLRGVVEDGHVVKLPERPLNIYSNRRGASHEKFHADARR